SGATSPEMPLAALDKDRETKWTTREQQPRAGTQVPWRRGRSIAVLRPPSYAGAQSSLWLRQNNRGIQEIQQGFRSPPLLSYASLRQISRRPPARVSPAVQNAEPPLLSLHRRERRLSLFRDA